MRGRLEYCEVGIYFSVSALITSLGSVTHASASVLAAPFEECNPWKYDVLVSFHAVIIFIPNVGAFSSTESTFHHIILSLPHLHCKHAYFVHSFSFTSSNLFRLMKPFFRFLVRRSYRLYEKGGLSHSNFNWRKITERLHEFILE